MRGQNKISVLLVEDNLEDARLLEITLSKAQPNQIDLHHSTTLKDAESFLKENKADLVLLDLSLPDGNGLECINKIKRLNPTLAIIILTGLDDQDFAIKTVQHGAQDYLVKGEGDGALILRAINYAIERKQIEQRLTLLAHFDGLTGLANREYFNNTLTQTIKLAKRSEQTVGLIFLDLDHFKEVNDSFGHEIGDKLLTKAADRLKSCVRGVDFIARLGGDEFTIILSDIKNPAIVIRIAEKIVSELSKPFELVNQDVFISSSVGIAIYPNDTLHANDLVKFADAAMYQAKDKGRNNFQFYTQELNAAAIEARALKKDLRGAIDANELLLYFQPKVDVLTNKIVGAEVLLRWHHPNRGVVSPEEFIPVAEHSGLIIGIGKWVISEAIKQTLIWQKRFDKDFCTSINLSVKQFQNNELLEFIDLELTHSSLNAATIEFEVTESMLIKKNHQEQNILQQLSKRGFKISIDDFGTGYSSLAYLKRLTIDALKIDRSFINDINFDADTAEIVKAIIAMAHALRLNVIAEGVENKQQKAFLKQLKCDQIQGYLISKPVPAEIFEQLLEQQYV